VLDIQFCYLWCLGVIWNNYVCIFNYEITLEALLIKAHVCDRVKHVSARILSLGGNQNFTAFTDPITHHVYLLC
jgi:hypothetical protein